jgi:vacuolar-type H+-ATPase subunit D/Vma8
MTDQELEKNLKEMKDQLKVLKSKRDELSQAISLIEKYVKDIESKMQTVKDFNTMSFKDINNTILKD